MGRLLVTGSSRVRFGLGVGLLAVAVAWTAYAADEPAPASAAQAVPAESVAPATPAPPANAASKPWKDPVDVPAEPMRLSAQALLLDMAEAGNRAIAVGERGIILVSQDRTQWTQVADVPTQSTLTAVAAAGSRLWAVGRDGVILHSNDAGDHWTLQRKDPWTAPTDDTPADDARHGAPLLDVLFLDENNGIAVGAYSLYLETADGGKTWNPRDILNNGAAPADSAEAAGDGKPRDKWTFSREELKIEEEGEPHFNAIARTSDGSLLIAGERGSLLRSRDGGQTWQRTKLPYDGSMFGAVGFEGQRAIVFGLRGHAFETDNLGDTWKELSTNTELTLLGGAKLAGGGVALVGANGLVLVRRSANEPFREGTVQPAGALSATLPVEGGTAFVVAGENGIGRFQPRQ
ncbi:WD40/YVTN/BNR-like repeat-containing protein [Tahibacter amnicola]|uniref:Photosynthesis system II assembly factor Ycf48/Hcf136-like domain-containing protein n=1 Tax=Tahibacter amnicola TaxID=2976241 RepID=A0ABY6BG87_9GAMM|nr:YCF48-related protein [Tahibacter amnicola]UXI68850.1 hypothetical protein N4264_04115 [Tahibacter amnicola]